LDPDVNLDLREFSQTAGTKKLPADDGNNPEDNESGVDWSGVRKAAFFADAQGTFRHLNECI
jgi:hypothetical protein